MLTKPILRDATVFVVNDYEIGGQGLLAVSREGALFVATPGSQVIAIELDKLEEYFTTGNGRTMDDVAGPVLAQIKNMREIA